MQPTTRVQANIVARQERRFLNWACEAMPSAIGPDHLTAFGILGAVMVLAGYAAANVDPRFLWLSPVGFVIHWLGDSLDGSLARHRESTRPRYGYFLDHSVDALCILLMIGGMGLSPFVRLDVALFVVVGYFALSIHVFLKHHVTNTFQLSFMALGPTELRIAFVIITFWMILGGIGGGSFPAVRMSNYDICLTVIGSVFCGLFVINTAVTILTLRAAEGNGRRRAPASPIADATLRSISRPVVGTRSR